MISFSQTGGTSGITQITISATSTQELADVVNHYTLGNESTSLDMPIVQKAYVPVQKYITMSPSAITWSSSNNTGSITINSNDSWVVVSDGWIQVSRMYESDISERYNSVSGNGNTIIGISCFENIGDARSGGITAYCQSNSAISATTTVSQAGGYVKPYITLGTYSMQVSGGSVTTAVTVQSNVSWSAITDSRWITINTLSGSGNGNVSFVVDANSSNIERRATITVFNGEINAVLVLTQAASVSRPYIILSPNSFSVPYEGSTGNTISVSANCDYDIEADVNWITVNAVSGSGDGSVSFSTSAMTGSSVGNIVFSNSAVTEYATVETAFIPYLSANTNNILSSSTGGTFEISVYSNVNWSVSVDTQEETLSTPWLSATPLSGSNDGSIRISIESGTTEKTGAIILYSSNYGLSWTIDILRNEPTSGRKIFYTSSDGNVVTPRTTVWGANIVSNTYVDGKGVIEFDGDLEVIPSEAFINETRLTSIVFPETLKRIEIRAFSGCTGLSGDLIIPNSVTLISVSGFYGSWIDGTLTIGNGYAADSAFKETKIKGLVLGSTFGSIGNRAFSGCTNLSSIYSFSTTQPTLYYQSNHLIFKNIAATGTLHYPSGSNYTDFKAQLPSGWTKVDDIMTTDDIFFEPTDFIVEATGSTGNVLTIITDPIQELSYSISSNVNWITVSEPTGTGVKSITFNTSPTTSTTVDTFGTIIVSNSGTSKTFSVRRKRLGPKSNEVFYTTTGGAVLDPYTTGGWGAAITGNTYTDGQGILAFHRDVTAFPYNAYSNKRELQTIDMPDSVTVISGQSFIYCSNLQEVTIGSGVTSILNYAFYSCSSLATIYAHPTTAPTLGTGVFGVASSGTLHYPSGSDYSSWISALPSGWTAVADL